MTTKTLPQRDPESTVIATPRKNLTCPARCVSTHVFRLHHLFHTRCLLGKAATSIGPQREKLCVPSPPRVGLICSEWVNLQSHVPSCASRHPLQHRRTWTFEQITGEGTPAGEVDLGWSVQFTTASSSKSRKSRKYINLQRGHEESLSPWLHLTHRQLLETL